MKRKYLVTVTHTKVETWEIEASSKEEAALNYEDGDLVSEDTRVEVSDVEDVSASDADYYISGVYSVPLRDST